MVEVPREIEGRQFRSPVIRVLEPGIALRGIRSCKIINSK